MSNLSARFCINRKFILFLLISYRIFLLIFSAYFFHIWLFFLAFCWFGSHLILLLLPTLWSFVPAKKVEWNSHHNAYSAWIITNYDQSNVLWWLNKVAKKLWSLTRSVKKAKIEVPWVTFFLLPQPWSRTLKNHVDAISEFSFVFSIFFGHNWIFFDYFLISFDHLSTFLTVFLTIYWPTSIIIWPKLTLFNQYYNSVL